MPQLPFEARKILLVEDEPLILLELESRLRAAGAAIVTASNLERGLGFAKQEELSAAVLDFQLRNEDTTAICCKLAERRVPFLFHTGRIYSAFQKWPSAPVILKSQTENLVGALVGILR